MAIPYATIGKITVWLICLSTIIIISALSIGFYSFKKKKVLFPNFVLFTLDLFYGPSKCICNAFSIKKTLIDEAMIEIRNATLLDKFKKIKKNKLLLGPKCLRHPLCKARCDPKIGYICIGCGKCPYARLKIESEKYGYKMFILPGVTFIKKIVKMYKPDAAIGIACYTELNEMMQKMSYFFPGQGIPLLRDGCFNTDVCVEEVIEKMRL